MTVAGKFCRSLRTITICCLLLLFAASQSAFAAAAPVIMPASGNTKDIPLIVTAKQYLGVKYVYGGTTPRGFDCSGFVQYVFEKHKKNLPRTADIQYKAGKPVSKIKDLQPGDLVFFATGKPKDVNHVGIYIGKDQFINAQTSKGVAIAKLTDAYWKAAYMGARRAL